MQEEQAFSHVKFGQARELILLSRVDIPEEYRETFGFWYEELASPDDRHRREGRPAQFPLTPWRRFTDIRGTVAHLFEDQLQCARDDYRLEDWS